MAPSLCDGLAADLLVVRQRDVLREPCRKLLGVLGGLIQRQLVVRVLRLW